MLMFFCVLFKEDLFKRAPVFVRKESLYFQTASSHGILPWKHKYIDVVHESDIVWKLDEREALNIPQENLQ